MESTNGWYWIDDLLHGNGIELVLANANRLKAISTAKIKTDQIDSTTMAQLLRIDYVPEAHQIDPCLRDKRDLMRARLRMIQIARNLVAIELTRIVYHVVTIQCDDDFTFKGKKSDARKRVSLAALDKPGDATGSLRSEVGIGKYLG